MTHFRLSQLKESPPASTPPLSSPPKPGSIRSYVVVESTAERLSVKEIQSDLLEILVRGKVRLVWDREGDRRLVPLVVIQNLNQTYQDGLKMIESLGLTDIYYYYWDSIGWEQTEELTDGVLTSAILYRLW
jgi:hypothetical protein